MWKLVGCIGGAVVVGAISAHPIGAIIGGVVGLFVGFLADGGTGDEG